MQFSYIDKQDNYVDMRLKLYVNKINHMLTQVRRMLQDDIIYFTRLS